MKKNKIMSLNFGTSFMSTEREIESCKVFVGGLFYPLQGFQILG